MKPSPNTSRRCSNRSGGLCRSPVKRNPKTHVPAATRSWTTLRSASEIPRPFLWLLPIGNGRDGWLSTGATTTSSTIMASANPPVKHIPTTPTPGPPQVACSALAKAEHATCGGPGVGVVGMCFTGGFALAMMVDDVVVAPVLSQPSLPFPIGKSHKKGLGISDADLKVVQDRVAAGTCVLGLRFTGDRHSPPERFEHLREVLGDGFIAVEIDSSPGNPYGHKSMAHSVLTEAVSYTHLTL